MATEACTDVMSTHEYSWSPEWALTPIQVSGRLDTHKCEYSFPTNDTCEWQIYSPLVPRLAVNGLVKAVALGSCFTQVQLPLVLEFLPLVWETVISHEFDDLQCHHHGHDLQWWV